MVAPPAEVRPDTYVEMTQYYGPQAIAVDVSGRRFVDEAACADESELCVATARDAEGRAYFVLDDALYHSTIGGSLEGEPMVDRVISAVRGSHVGAVHAAVSPALLHR
jgi:hypothetical protein